MHRADELTRSEYAALVRAKVELKVGTSIEYYHPEWAEVVQENLWTGEIIEVQTKNGGKIFVAAATTGRGYHELEGHIRVYAKDVEGSPTWERINECLLVPGPLGKRSRKRLNKTYAKKQNRILKESWKKTVQHGTMKDVSFNEFIRKPAKFRTPPCSESD
jgi:hypothetical protein